jgi:HSP20 family protein
MTDVPTDVFSVKDKVIVVGSCRSQSRGRRVDHSAELDRRNGRREFSYDAGDVRFLSRGMFLGQFTKRISLGEGLNLDDVSARYDNGILELTIPFREEVQLKKFAIESGDKKALSS